MVAQLPFEPDQAHPFVMERHYLAGDARQSGTSSIPEPPQGWQRPMRRAASQPPLIPP
ncbi:MAG: hypothetical protein ACI91Z_000984, partial [Yoonia sp.]